MRLNMRAYEAPDFWKIRAFLRETFLLNVKLGFKPTPGWVHMRKTMGAAAGGAPAAEETS